MATGPCLARRCQLPVSLWKDHGRWQSARSKCGEHEEVPEIHVGKLEMDSNKVTCFPCLIVYAVLYVESISQAIPLLQVVYNPAKSCILPQSERNVHSANHPSETILIHRDHRSILSRLESDHLDFSSYWLGDIQKVFNPPFLRELSALNSFNSIASSQCK